MHPRQLNYCSSNESDWREPDGAILSHFARLDRLGREGEALFTQMVTSDVKDSKVRLAVSGRKEHLSEVGNLLGCQGAVVDDDLVQSTIEPLGPSCAEFDEIGLQRERIP